jgi:ABC-type bacteriocin transporter
VFAERLTVAGDPRQPQHLDRGGGELARHAGHREGPRRPGGAIIRPHARDRDPAWAPTVNANPKHRGHGGAGGADDPAHLDVAAAARERELGDAGGTAHAQAATKSDRDLGVGRRRIGDDEREDHEGAGANDHGPWPLQARCRARMRAAADRRRHAANSRTAGCASRAAGPAGSRIELARPRGWRWTAACKCTAAMSWTRSALFRQPVCVRQTDQSDCGPACLATVALHYGRRVSREALRAAAGTDRVGTNLLGLVRAAEALGFAPRAVRATWDALATAALPAIAHVTNAQGQGHFVVLHRVATDHVIVADPAGGVERRTRDAFTKQWNGYLLLLTPSALASSTLPSPRSPWRRLGGLVTAQRRALTYAYACAATLALLTIASSLFVQHVVDGVARGDDAPFLRALAIGMAVVVPLRAGFVALRHYLVAWIGRQVGLELMTGFVRHVLRVPLRFFETRSTGDVLSRVADSAKLRDAIGGAVLSTIVDLTTVVLALAALFVHDVELALVAAAFIPVLALVVAAHYGPTRRRARRAMEQAALVQTRLVEDVTGIDTVKALGLERRRADQADDAMTGYAMAAFQLQTVGVSLQALIALITGAAAAAILWFGSGRVLAGDLSLGQLMFCNAILAYLLEPLQRLASVGLQFQDAVVAGERLEQVFEHAAEDDAGARPPAPPVTGGLELRGVGFDYGPRTPVLRGIDLTIPAGRTTAIVGESGSGKSTLLKLLLRFHQPTAGQILCDGTDLRDLDLASWRARLGVVAQEPAIFAGTIRDNVLAAAPDATPERVAAAVRAAGLDAVVARLPERWDTQLGERGQNLSGGQRQRLAIARALARQPDVLLLDEATSHLDTATEALIQDALDGRDGQTVIVVAHRLSTVRRADQIVVLHDGQVAERGTHDDLLARGGRYAALWAAQHGSEPPRRLAVGAEGAR